MQGAEQLSDCDKEVHLQCSLITSGQSRQCYDESWDTHSLTQCCY